MSIPEYWQCWDISTLKPVDMLADKDVISSGNIKYSSEWKEKDGLKISNKKGGVLAASFRGTHVAVTGESNPHSGYAKVSILNAKNDTVYSSLVDFYSKYPEKAIRIMTPKMPEASYTLLIEITGLKPVWTDKTKRIYGSDNTSVSIGDIYIFN